MDIANFLSISSKTTLRDEVMRKHVRMKKKNVQTDSNFFFILYYKALENPCQCQRKQSPLCFKY